MFCSSKGRRSTQELGRWAFARQIAVVTLLWSVMTAVVVEGAPFSSNKIGLPQGTLLAFVDRSAMQGGFDSKVQKNEKTGISKSVLVYAEDCKDSFVLGCRGGGFLPAGYNPFGYKITALGERFLEFGTTCLESDIGRLLASLKSKRKTLATIQTEWLEIVRISKKGQSMRIYRSLQDMIDFCLAARLID